MRQQSDLASAQRLTAADVAVLQGDRSPENRALVAAKFGRQFDDLALSPQRDLAMAVLQLLVQDVAKEVRLTLAEHLEDLGLHVLDVADAEAALDILARPPGDLTVLVTDLNLGPGAPLAAAAAAAAAPAASVCPPRADVIIAGTTRATPAPARLGSTARAGAASPSPPSRRTPPPPSPLAR